MIKKVLKINGQPRTLIVREEDSLAKVLREQMMLTGCKVGCGQGQCGTCTVIVNGKAVRSCIVKMSKLEDDSEIETIEGIGTVDDLHPLQVAWMGHGCAQCGFCSPGFIMNVLAMVRELEDPGTEEIKEYLSGNLCRCTGYMGQLRAIKKYLQWKKEEVRL